VRSDQGKVNGPAKKALSPVHSRFEGYDMTSTFAHRLARVAAAIALTLAAGCGSSDDPEVVCNGVAVGGKCLKKCDDTACAQNNLCYTTSARPEGFCSIPCADTSACPEGFACDAATAMSSGAAANVCAHLAIPDGGTRDTACSGPEACDAAHGLSCVSGTCQYACSDSTECPSTLADASGNTVETACDGTVCKPVTELPPPGGLGGDCAVTGLCDQAAGLSCIEGVCTLPCDSLQVGCPEGFTCTSTSTLQGMPGYCAPNGQGQGPGQYGTSCPTGSAQCDSANDFLCVGPEGSSDAYCTKKAGCTQDAECPSGFWCGAIRVASGTQDVDFSDQPRACLRRTFCTPCEVDLDCSFQTNGICVPDANGEKFCSLPCTAGTDSCILGTQCDDVGDGRTACRPDLGSCHVDQPTGCSPCRIDADCGPNALCSASGLGWKPGMSWCMTPCGGPDANGKSTCPTAPNGLEMVCLDENQVSLGGPFSSSDPNYIYKHCYAPYTIDVSGKYPGVDPPNDVCGNYRREGDEECDDGNQSETDGCTTDCKITAACKFTVTEPNDDTSPVISPVPNHITLGGTDNDPAFDYVIDAAKCQTFLVEGALETAGDVDDIAFKLSNKYYAWLDSYTSTIGACSDADLVTEVRAWREREKLTDPVLMDTSIPCEDLSNETLDLANGQVCGTDPDTGDYYLGCGSCDTPGICGSCDDDTGYGDCTRMMLTTATVLASSIGNLEIRYEGKYKMIRVYAKDPQATVANYMIVVSRFVAESIGPATPPGMTCY
jgi:cysteine-rich repeat protein